MSRFQHDRDQIIESFGCSGGQGTGLNSGSLESEAMTLTTRDMTEMFSSVCIIQIKMNN